jgi:tRNA nucleotidyltransferase/poly(A) polymerase
MDRNFEYSPILQERALSPEAAFWVNKIQSVASRTGIVGYLKGGLLRDYVSNFYNGTTLSAKDLDIMLLNGVNLAVGELVKEGANIQLRRNRRKTPVFELSLPTSSGSIHADIGIVLGKPNTYEKGHGRETIIDDDARLSDFTINTLFLPLDKPLSINNIIDPLGGIQDIEQRKIRMVAPNTFVRNPECMLRAVRMADRLSATIEPGTYDAITRYAHLITKAPQPVVDQNLKSLLESPNRERNIEMLDVLGLREYLSLG